MNPHVHSWTFIANFDWVISTQMVLYAGRDLQDTFITFVGGKLLGPTFLGSPTVRTVGVGVTFSLLNWKFCWTYRYNDSKNCWTVEPAFDPFVGPTISGQQHIKAPMTVV